MFEKATRLKLRFPTSKGQLSIEDLWGLPLTSSTGAANLDDIARELFKQLKSDDKVSFVTPAQKSDATVQLKFDLVKHVIDTRVAENAAAATQRDRAEKKRRLLEILANKEAEQLGASSIEELRKQLAALEG